MTIDEADNSRPTESFRRLLDRLSALSVERHSEAYRSIEWNDPAMAISPDDRRWVLPAWDPVGSSNWYRDQPVDRQAAIGLHRASCTMKVAVDFEAGLQQGLVAFAALLPNGHPAFRYAYHEITEEAQHSMMFQEFIARSGFDIPPPEDPMAMKARILSIASRTPVLFFVSVLSGEEPIDVIQERIVRSGQGQHPLLVKICQVHRQEEARHLSFARAVLRELSPSLTPRQRRMTSYEAPLTAQRMARLMMGISPAFADYWSIPSDVRVDMEVSVEMQKLLRAGIGPTRAACHESGLFPSRLEGVWENLHLRRAV
jgi:hypothetical protein